ncbi:MAG: T9SS type A sorting domain-containing protein [candidate division KSB1 bacterium]|jgi:hypothetical protein|nr:T9SS type A sorting domain-containing protein [candidate division KSB1 bacterium]
MKLKTTKWIVLLTVVMLIPLVSGCFKIITITQPSTTNPGEKVTVHMVVRTDGTEANPKYGIVAFLVPNDWSVDMVRYEGDFGPDTCTFLHPDSGDANPGNVDLWEPELEKNYPSGDDMMWVVYQGTKPYTSELDTGYVDVYAEMTAGATEGLFDIGYFVTNADLDLTDPGYFSIDLDNPILNGKPDKHLLISEFVVTPTDGEFIEIYNGTGMDIDLSNYYLYDAQFQNDNDYINIVDKSYTPFGSDFLAKFPDGTIIENGGFIVVATTGDGFNTVYGMDADFELRGTSETTPDMVSPEEGYIGGSAGLSNSAECIILFHWDGMSDLVQDVDYVLWGDKDEWIDKTGVTKDGPDADAVASAYLPDTPKENQTVVTDDVPHAFGQSAARKEMVEVGETMAGGNGLIGHDETSEDFTMAFSSVDPTPGDFPAAGMVNVTFVCNTAAWQDTVGATGLVQLRGTTMTEAGQATDDASVDTLSPGVIINWGALSTMYLENVDGDYWQATFRVPEGTKMAYKFFVNAAHDTVAPGDEWEHTGWEGGVTNPPGIYSGNRGLDLSGFTGSDTVLPVQFANGWKGQLDDQYEKPYEEIDGTFAVHLRTNMFGWGDFDPGKHVVGVRGSNMSDWGNTGEICWANTFALTREGQSGIGGAFYSGTVHVPDQYATAGLKFKFVVHLKGNPLDEDWGDMVFNPSQEYEVTTTGNDTTVHWKWFANLVPKQATHPDEIIVHYMVDLATAVADRGFVLGDTLQVRAGYGQTADKRYDLYLNRQGAGTIYAGTDTLMAMIDREMFYQYYSVIDGVEYREIYFNFDFPDPSSGEAERRAITPDTNEVFIEDIVPSITDSRRQPRFRNVEVIAQDSIVVTLTCDARPAIYQVMAGDTLDDIQGFVDVVHPDSVLTWGMAVNGPITGGWSCTGGNWGRHLMTTANKAMNDDGINGDVAAGDSIFSIVFTMYKDSTTQTNGPTNIIGQEFKFGVGGGDNEGGFGNNHIVNVDDSQDFFTIEAQFGSIDPGFYDQWDFNKRGPKTGVDFASGPAVPEVYALEQNYPNPFNPTTHISYKLPKTSAVKLTVYNMLGQKVATLVDKKQIAGNHQVQWDGKDLQGMIVSTGIYFYKIEAGDFTMTKKMMLMK